MGVMVVLFLAGSLGALADRAEKVPAGFVALIRGVPVPNGQLSLREFNKRKGQVRAERRATHVTNGISSGEEALRQMLEEIEVLAEAKRLGIRVGIREVNKAFREVKFRVFESIGQFDEYLRRTRLTEKEARHRVRVQLLFKRIESKVTSGKNGLKKVTALLRFARRYVHRWRSRTICLPSLATERCSNGPPLSAEHVLEFAVGRP
jgi:parvulin-like peptidyl-prolyl isomerase